MRWFGLIFLSLCVSLGAAIESRIINGVPVNIEDYSYQLFFRTNGGICGASIISEDWALTAAHCVERFAYGYLHAGTPNVNEAKGSVHTVLEAVYHPKWNNRTLDYDYGLLKVYPPFDLNSGLTAVKLADTDPTNGLVVNLAGWGVDTFGGNMTRKLMGAKFSIMSKTNCGKYFTPLTDRMVCASSAADEQTGCSGDSGGALVDKVTGIQYGVTSFVGYGCPSKGLPNVFANVANQRDWIRNVTGV